MYTTEKMTRGNQSFQKLIWFLYFSGLLIYFLLYIGMNTESRGGQQTWPLSKSGASYKCIPHFDRWKPQLQSRRRVFPSVTTSRVIRRGDGIGILGKKLFNYRYKERLERNSVVGRLVEKKRLNNLVYLENQSPPM